MKTPCSSYCLKSPSSRPTSSLPGDSDEKCYNRWVHSNLVSRPQVYFNLTSDVNGSNFNLSSLLCSHGNKSGLEEPKCISKLCSTNPHWRTYPLSKQLQEIEITNISSIFKSFTGQEKPSDHGSQRIHNFLNSCFTENKINHSSQEYPCTTLVDSDDDS